MTNEALFQQALIKSVFLLTKRLENTILLTFNDLNYKENDGIHGKTIDERRISWWCRRV